MIRKTSHKDLGESGVFLCRVHHERIQVTLLEVVMSNEEKRESVQVCWDQGESAAPTNSLPLL